VVSVIRLGDRFGVVHSKRDRPFPSADRADGVRADSDRGWDYNAAAMAFKLSRTYKLILALTVVIAPFTWLVFTTDGQRRTDLMLLHLLGKPSFDIAYARLVPDVDQADVAAQFPDVAFECADASSRLGDRVCAAEIASFNGMPARTVRFYYGGGRLAAMQLDYRRRYHDLLAESLRGGLGQPTPLDADLVSWSLDDGLLLLPAERPSSQTDAALIWLAPQQAR
jgi:hypothetical protein